MIKQNCLCVHCRLKCGFNSITKQMIHFLSILIRVIWWPIKCLNRLYLFTIFTNSIIVFNRRWVIRMLFHCTCQKKKCGILFSKWFFRHRETHQDFNVNRACCMFTFPQKYLANQNKFPRSLLTRILTLSLFTFLEYFIKIH